MTDVTTVQIPPSGSRAQPGPSTEHYERSPAKFWDLQTSAAFVDYCLPLLDANDRQRMAWLKAVADLAGRVVEKRGDAAHYRKTAWWFQRIAAGASAAVATLAGGTLIGDLHGGAATALGIIAAIVGIAAGAIAAARPGDSYTADLMRSAQYEQLWWDMRSFSMTELPTVAPAAFAAAFAGFVAREEEIMAGPPTAASKPPSH